MTWPIKQAVRGELATLLAIFQDGDDETVRVAARFEGRLATVALLQLLDRHQPDEDGKCDDCFAARPLLTRLITRPGLCTVYRQVRAAQQDEDAADRRHRLVQRSTSTPVPAR
ncbi:MULTISPECIES: hypothetical protein [unclassified Crossiella]|uniref:hypothetical protein n=1 Tax=unclassified Crossiella TaxID=2620835 RepID=UPI001FFF5897|nr:MULTISPECIES: hypothetical protein [unclassified Crossiella]MCK2240999.1 hypothetical protein [Crossiella sp. S99.2]MCK2253857.1 hypothetical protein [Crossiella sp. S99.1]